MSELPSPVLSDISLIQQAIGLACRQHRYQNRKDERTPYVAHPIRVFFTVRHVFGIDDTVALCAALLHDTIEDTTTDYDEIAERFGKDIADAVAVLSKDMRLPGEEREKRYDEGLEKASWQARAVKLADVYDNFCDAPTESIRAKAAKKIPRAIACAGDDERLKEPIEIVRRLLDS